MGLYGQTLNTNSRMFVVTPAKYKKQKKATCLQVAFSFII